MGSNYFPGMISDNRAGVLSNCLFLRKSSNITCIFFSFFFVCGMGGLLTFDPSVPSGSVHAL